MLCSVANVNAQSTFLFAPGEAQRVYDLLDGLGCIDNDNCHALRDFTPTSSCSANLAYLKCDSQGFLEHL
jgi:hypothetical protein